MYMSLLSAYTFFYHICFWCLLRQWKGVRSPGTKVMDGCELPYGCWKSNTGPLQEQFVFLIAMPSPHLDVLDFKIQIPNTSLPWLHQNHTVADSCGCYFANICLFPLSALSPSWQLTTFWASLLILSLAALDLVFILQSL